MASVEWSFTITDMLQGSVKTAGSHVSQLEAEYMNMSPVARDESALRMQERQIEVESSCLGILLLCYFDVTCRHCGPGV